MSTEAGEGKGQGQGQDVPHSASQSVPASPHTHTLSRSGRGRSLRAFSPRSGVPRRSVSPPPGFAHARSLARSPPRVSREEVRAGGAAAAAATAAAAAAAAAALQPGERGASKQASKRREKPVAHGTIFL